MFPAYQPAAADEEARCGASRKGVKTCLLIEHLPEENPPSIEHHLKQLLSQFGNLEECEVIVDPNTSLSRGHAFVRFDTQRDAEHAKAALDGAGFLGAGPLKLRWLLNTATLYVSDLAPNVTTDLLREAFRQFGDVVNCRLERQPPELGGASKCYGFVEYAKRTVAASVQQLIADNLFLISGSPRPVHVEFAIDTDVDDEEGRAVTAGFSANAEAEPPPHFAQPQSLEFDFALRWRELALAHKAEQDRLAEAHRQERELLRRELAEIYMREHHKFQVIDNAQLAFQQTTPSPSHLGVSHGQGGGQGVAQEQGSSCSITGKKRHF